MLTWLCYSFIAVAAGHIMSVGYHASFNPQPSPPDLQEASPDTTKQKFVDVEIDEEEIPDSLLHPRWPVQRTTPITYDDLDQGIFDLQRPDNMKQTVEYNDSLDRYVIGYKIGGTYVATPVMMTQEEYMKWSER
jgi:hypothetical protein